MELLIELLTLLILCKYLFNRITKLRKVGHHWETTFDGVQFEPKDRGAMGKGVVWSTGGMNSVWSYGVVNRGHDTVFTLFICYEVKCGLMVWSTGCMTSIEIRIR